jgi:hypothetical protein
VINWISFDVVNLLWLLAADEVLTRLPHMTNRKIPEITPKGWNKTQLALLSLFVNCIIPRKPPLKNRKRTEAEE